MRPSHGVHSQDHPRRISPGPRPMGAVGRRYLRFAGRGRRRRSSAADHISSRRAGRLVPGASCPLGDWPAGGARKRICRRHQERARILAPWTDSRADRVRARLRGGSCSAGRNTAAQQLVSLRGLAMADRDGDLPGPWGVFTATGFVGLLLRRPWSRPTAALLAFGWALLPVWQLAEQLVHGHRVSPAEYATLIAGTAVLSFLGYHILSSRRINGLLGSDRERRVVR